MSDRVSRLVEQAQEGSTTAFEELVRLHVGLTFAIARSLVGSKEDAEDVVQESLFRAWTRLHQCREPHHFKAWLLTVVRSVALSHRERESRRWTRQAELGTEHPDPSPGPDREAERREAGRRLETMLNELNEKQRAVIMLHDLEGYSHAEIADLLQMSNESSRRYLSDARRLLASRHRPEEEQA